MVIRFAIGEDTSHNPKYRWFPTAIALGFGIIAVVLGAILFHTRYVISTPKKAVMNYIKQYAKANSQVVLPSRPVEYYDGGAYVLGESTNHKDYTVYFVLQNSKGQWVAHLVTQFPVKNFLHPTGNSNLNALSDRSISGFFDVRNPVLVTGALPRKVVGYEHLVSGHSQQIPFTFHRLWNSPYWIHYFPSNTMSVSNRKQSKAFPAIKIEKVVAYDKNGKIISR